MKIEYKLVTAEHQFTITYICPLDILFLLLFIEVKTKRAAMQLLYTKA